MANNNLLEPVRAGILLSRDLSKREGKNFYEEEIPFRINVEKLAAVVKKHLNTIGSKITSIVVNEFDGFENSSTSGILKISDNSAEIIVNSKLNECWKRFTICKELLQLYCDSDLENTVHFSIDEIIKQIDTLNETQTRLFSVSSEGISGLKSSFVDDKSYNEIQAVIMTMELIFAHKEKDEEKNEEKAKLVEFIFQAVNEGLITYYDVALAYKMPEYMINKYHLGFYNLSLDIK